MSFEQLRSLDLELIPYTRLNRIKKLDFDRQYQLAFEQVFGKTIICQSLEIAGAYTRSHNLNSITLDGDKYDRKGSLTGGYHDQKRSRLDAVKNLKTWQVKAEEMTAQRDEVTRTTAVVDQQVTQLVGQIQVAEGKLQRLNEEREPMVQGVMQAQLEADRTRTRIAKLESNLESLRQDVRNLKAEKEAYEKELKTKMDQALSDEELRKVQDLNVEVEQTKKNLIDQAKEAARVSLRSNCHLANFADARPAPACSSRARRTSSRSSSARTSVEGARSCAARSSPMALLDLNRLRMKMSRRARPS